MTEPEAPTQNGAFLKRLNKALSSNKGLRDFLLEEFPTHRNIQGICTALSRGNPQEAQRLFAADSSTILPAKMDDYHLVCDAMSSRGAARDR